MTPTPVMPPDPAPRRILRRDQLDRMRSAEDIIAEAERRRAESERAAQEARQTLLTEARERALQESTRTAARIIAEAEAAAKRRLDALEPELARLVARTVREILGEFEPAEASYHAALTALRRLREHRSCRIYASSETIPPVRRAVADLAGDENAAKVEALIADDRLPKGRVILSSERGQAEIGLAALTDAALQSWEDGDDDAPAPAPQDEAS